MLYIKKSYKYNFKLIRGGEEIPGPESTLEIAKTDVSPFEKISKPELTINSIEELLAVIQDLQPSLMFIMRKSSDYNLNNVDAKVLETINGLISNIRSVITLGEGNSLSDQQVSLVAESGKELLKKIPTNSKDYLLLSVAISIISNHNNIVSFE
jgi:hypothetical protein